MTDISTPWLHIMGVGEAGIATLSKDLMDIIEQADAVFGAPRFLSQLKDTKGQTRHGWQSPFAQMIDQIIAHKGRKTIVLASGDPNWFGIGSTLSRRLKSSEFELHPVPSSFQLAAAHLHWPMQTINTISLHGRPVENLHKALFPGARILALTSNAKTLHEVAQVLTRRNYAASTLTILENLGSDIQRVTTLKAHEAGAKKPGDLYVLAIECIAGKNIEIQSLTPGLSNELFEHDGQLTKRQVRAITLSSLSPFPGAVLWDVGAGCGSIGIEWMRAAPNAKAVCFEKNQKRCEAIGKNKNLLGVPDLQIIHGNAPEALTQNTPPDAIFIGGNVSDENQFLACWQALKPGGRLVVNAVTQQSIFALEQRQKCHGGELFTIAISEMESLGKSTIMQPKLPVTQWAVTKPFGNNY